MMIALFVVGILTAVFLLRRRARKAELAGLTANRPVFSVEPPSRRIGKLKGERL